MNTVIFNHGKSKINVYCVCGGFGFPYGTASTKRIALIGRALTSTGATFQVFHVGPSPFAGNSKKRGWYKGMCFHYLGPSVRWPGSFVVRGLCYALGGLELFFRLLACRKDGVVYCYYQGNGMNLWTLLVCRVLKLPAVQEACEWWPGTEHETIFSKWMYTRVMFRLSRGAMPISKIIEQRIRSVASPSYKICPVPVLVDTEENAGYGPGPLDRMQQPVFVWCGMVDGYKRDVLFLIDALALLRSEAGKQSVLMIIGPCSDSMRSVLLAYADAKHVSRERIDIRGYVTDRELWNNCAKAQALLMPMWGDDRSSSRFPTKFGQYLAAQRPVVTCAVGEVRRFLSDDTAFLYTPGDLESLAHALERCMGDPAQVENIVRRATVSVLPRLDYRSHGPAINLFFKDLLKK